MGLWLCRLSILVVHPSKLIFGNSCRKHPVSLQAVRGLIVLVSNCLRFLGVPTPTESFRFSSLTCTLKWRQSHSLPCTVSQFSERFTRKGYAISEWFMPEGEYVAKVGWLVDFDREGSPAC
jgi:hypothetical protein